MRARGPMTLAYIRPIFVCSALILFASIVYGGSYQRTRDGQTLVWRDVPSRGDEATWSGKRDKDGFATGSGVLTWYKSDPSIVTGSNIVDRRRYAVVIDHYSGTMVHGRFKGAVSYLEGVGKKSRETAVQRADRTNRRQKATRERTAEARANPTPEETSTPFSQPIVIDTPERTSVIATSTPVPEQSAAPVAEKPKPATSRETDLARTIETTTSSSGTAPDKSPRPIADVQQTAISPETAMAGASDKGAPSETALEQSPQRIPQQTQPAVPSDTPAFASQDVAAAQQSTAGESASPTPQESQSEVPPGPGTLVAKRMTTPPSEQTTEPDAQTANAPTPTPNEILRSSSRRPLELPKPARDIDEQTVARLDTLYHSAVKANDVAIMDEILADDFVLETDGGASLTKSDLIKEAQEKRTTYQQQEVEKGTKKVRIWRDTAVVTGLLKTKGTKDNNPFEYQLLVSDTYVRTPTGWRYVFGQASKPESK